MSDSPMQPADLAQQLGRLADAADRGQPNVVPALLEKCLALCVEAVSAGASRSTVADLQQRLKVWLDVWPRLGKDPQFRAAVAREARHWASQCARGNKV